MADKKVKNVIKLVIPAGGAKPTPPVGSTLGPQGINLMQFCKDFNDQTAKMTGSIPCVVTIYEDRSFTFELKTPAVSELVKQAINIQVGSAEPNRKKVGSITMAQIRQIAERKQQDTNGFTVDAVMQMVMGTCKSMGVKVSD
jgi:large subunit ribosomal protein L11